MTGCQKKPKFLLWHDLRFPDGTLILFFKKKKEREKQKRKENKNGNVKIMMHCFSNATFINTNIPYNLLQE